jgi:hypothetical protein
VVERVGGAPVRRWLYQDGLNPVAELDGAGNLVQRFVYATRAHVPDLVVRGADVYRVVTDPLGSPRRIVDVATGAVVQALDYDRKRSTEPSLGLMALV